MHLPFFRLRSLFLFFRYRPGVDCTSFFKNLNMLIFMPFFVSIISGFCLCELGYNCVGDGLKHVVRL